MKKFRIDRIKKNKTLVNGGLFSLFSFIGKGMSFLLLILLANYIPPSEYGSLSLFTTVVSFLTIFMALSTNGYFSVAFFKHDYNDFRKSAAIIFLTGVATLLFFVFVVLVGGESLGQALEMPQGLLLYAVAISFLTFVFRIQQDYYRINEDVIKYGVYNVGNAILNFSLSLLLVISFGQGWLGRVNAQLWCTVIFGIISIVFLFKHRLLNFGFNKELYKKIIIWGLPMIPHHATGWIRQGLDRYIINYSYTTYEVGFFSFALNICNVIDMIGMAFNATNSVTLFQTLSNKELDDREKQKILNRQTRMIGSIYIVSAVIVVVLTTPLVYVVLPKYYEAVPFIWILSLSGWMKCMYYLYSNYLFYYNQTKQLMYITFSTSLAHLLLSFFFTRFSLYYTAIIYVFVQGAMTLIVAIKAKKILSQHLVCN